MDDTPTSPTRTKPDLSAALRVARAEDAVRSDVIATMRSLALARLQVLRDALHPVLAQVPPDVDLFDVGLMPGDPPRLFIDMVGFVEMARDRRGFHLYQDRRHDRVLIAEAATLDDAVEAVTLYMARRLVERDKTLLSDEATRGAAPVAIGRKSPPSGRAQGIWIKSLRLDWYTAGQIFWFVVEVLGLLAMSGLVLLGLHAAFLAFWGG